MPVKRRRYAYHSKNNTHVIYVDAKTITISKWE